MRLIEPFRPRFGDVGLHWPGDSQELMWNHRTGERLSQGEAWITILFLRFVVEPLVLAAASEIPSCASIRHSLSTVPPVTTSKFTFVYVLRPLSTGQPYQVHGNYQWDLTHHSLLQPLRAAILRDPVSNARWLSTHPDFGPLLDLRVEGGRVLLGDVTYDPMPHLPHASGAHLQDGAVDPTPRLPDPPLSAAQAALLEAVHEAHEAHAHALLVGDSQAGLLAQRVVATQHAFESSARTPREQLLFTLVFTGAIHPGHPKEHVDALTRATDLAHDDWSAAFNTDTGQPPDFVRVIAGNFAHARAHYLRAAPPGIALRTICPAALVGQGIMRCPVTEAA